MKTKREWKEIIEKIVEEKASNSYFTTIYPEEKTYLVLSSWDDVNAVNNAILEANNNETELQFIEDDIEDFLTIETREYPRLDSIMSYLCDSDITFGDEVFYCDDCNKTYFSYNMKGYGSGTREIWFPDFSACEYCVRENLQEEYLEYLTNNTNNGNTVLSKDQLRNNGFTPLPEKYAAGLRYSHDDPVKVMSELLEKNPEGQYIFNLETDDPYETTFQVWVKKGE